MTIPTTPSLDEARAEVAARIDAALVAWQALKGYKPPVEAENRAMVDLASAEAARPFLTWEMRFRGGYLASLGADPLSRQLGQVILSTKVKEGSGTAGSLQLLSHTIRYLQDWAGTVVQTFEAEVHDGFSRQGWYFIPCLINFQIDHIAAAP